MLHNWKAQKLTGLSKQMLHLLDSIVKSHIVKALKQIKKIKYDR